MAEKTETGELPDKHTNEDETFIYTTYDAATGEITGWARGDQGDADLDAPYVLGRYSRQLYRIENGEAVKKGNAPEIERELSLTTLRQKRDKLLAGSDWTQLPDSPLTNRQKKRWAKFRQALRDLPQTTGDPQTPKWPTKPKDEDQ